MKKDIILIGGGGHCKSCIDVIDSTNKYSIKGILDLPENVGKLILGYPIIGTDSDIPVLIKRKIFFLVTIGAVGKPTKRIELFNKVVSLNGNLITVISSTAYISKYSKIGTGSIIMHCALINASAEVGRNCIINSKALIEHDSVVGDHCHIATGAIINGGTIIGSNSFVGSGAVTKHYINISESAFIKANSIVK